MKVINKYKLYVMSLIASIGIVGYAITNYSIKDGVDKLDKIIDSKRTIANNKSEVEYKQAILADIQNMNSQVQTLITHKTSYSELDILGKIGEILNLRQSVKLVKSTYLIDAVSNTTQPVQTGMTQTATASTGMDIPTAAPVTTDIPTAPSSDISDTQEETTEIEEQNSIAGEATEGATSEDMLYNVTEEVVFDNIFTQVYDDSYTYLGVTLKSDDMSEILLAVSELESLGLRYKYIDVNIGARITEIDLVIHLN